LVAGWAAFALICTWLMWMFPTQETIPFHFMWISMALVFGLVTWQVARMFSVLGVVTVVTGVMLLYRARQGYIPIEELAEVPLMAALFLVMVWHVRRRQLAMEQVERMAGLERQRSEAQQMFVRLGSHELRTPITVARGYVELIRAAYSDRQTVEDTGIVLDELAKLERITARLTTLMAVETPRRVSPVDLDTLLDRLVHRWSPVATRRWRVDSTVGTLVANAERLETALDNLIENAIKFTDTDDVIELVARLERGHVLIQVTDTGEGIAEKDLPHIFEPFRSGHNAGSKAGTGLGLTIAKAAIESWGGTISVHSRLGEGTTFTARVPDQIM
jgi:two-component system, OmpR family, sensor kinase